MARRALLVGVEQFVDPRLGKLNAPEADVKALAAVLKDGDRGTFDSVDVDVSGDYRRMRNLISKFFLTRAPDDLILFYYSGHGILSRRNRLFLASGSSNLDVPQAESISANEMREWMSECRAEQQIILLDCCHSGAFVEGVKSGSTRAVTPQTFEVEGAGQYILTASDALQFAWDGQDMREGPVHYSNLSKFTSWLVDGLDGRAAPESEQVCMNELYQYTTRRARVEGSLATPQRFVHGSIGNPAICRNPGAGETRIAEDVKNDLNSVEWTKRLVAVSVLEQLLRDDPASRVGVRNLLGKKLQIERDVGVRGAIERVIAELDVDETETGLAITLANKRAAEGSVRQEEERKTDAAARVAEEKRSTDEAARLVEKRRKTDAAARVAEEKRRTDEAARLVEERRKSDDSVRLAEKTQTAKPAEEMGWGQILGWIFGGFVALGMLSKCMSGNW